MKIGDEKKSKRNRDKLKKGAEERKRRDLKEWIRLNPHLVESEAEKQWRKQQLKKKSRKRTRKKSERGKSEFVHDSWKEYIPLNFDPFHLSNNPYEKPSRALGKINIYKERRKR